ncbi:hypothetical protein SLS60_011914 [Paraconiothyrium brasiliense]|uniref:C2H2-type domain-containing protein n=1 Tax=Paraconiothyrium brasiliense TaxID=300254 RepID=A0ABR3QI50_9PLEO
MAVTITRPQRLVAVVIPCKGANARTASPHQKAKPQTVANLPPQAVHAAADRTAMPAEARSSFKSSDVVSSVLDLTGGEPRTELPIAGAELKTGRDSRPEAGAGRKRSIDGDEIAEWARSFEAEGPSKRKRKPRSKELIAYEEKKWEAKKFCFRVEEMAAFCLVSHIIAIGFGRAAFYYPYASVEQTFGLRVPDELNALRIEWKDKLLKLPFFCDATKIAGIHNILIQKPFPYQKYRETFVEWGIEAGMPGWMQLYDIRRAAGRKLDGALSKPERDQVMDHSGDTYNRYYVPTYIAEDFQAIYFGTPPQKDLVQSVSRIGFLRDPRAPKALTEEQKRDICNDPELISLAEIRKACLLKIYERGYKSVKSAKGEVCVEYKAAVKHFNSAKQKLLRNGLVKTREDYFKNVYKLEISAQLRGEKVVAAAEHATPARMQFEIEERATFVGIMSEPASSDGDLILRIRTLASLCHKQETRRLSPAAGQKRKHADFTTEENQPPASRRKRTQIEFITEQYQPPALGKHSKSRSPCAHTEVNESGTNNQQRGTELEFPMFLGARVCGFCLRTRSLPNEKRMKVYERQDVFDKHIGAHLRGDPTLQAEFQCYHPSCTTLLKDPEDFKRHDLDVHGVRHGVPHSR